MTADTSTPDAAAGALRGDAARSDAGLLRAFVVTAGIGWSVLFVVVGLRYGLQMYADGSIFSYSVSVQDAWAFHWHNISGRLFVYLFTFVPAESYVALTRDARGGVFFYGLLFFSAQFLGLIATFAADRSKGRVIFATACLSTTCLCPLVFGFPTEMWMAHALFWPALAAAHHVRRGIGGLAAVSALLLALVLSHEGALIFALAILFTVLLRGLRDDAFLRAAGAFIVVVAIWAAVKASFPPDDYFASVLPDAALNLVDVGNLANDLLRLLAGALAGYAIAFLILRRLTPAKAHIYAAAILAVALAVYWLWFDRALHTDNRYYLRTALLIGTPALGLLAAVAALAAEGRLKLWPALRSPPLLARLIAAVTGGAAVRASLGAVVVVMLVHAVETAKFVAAWMQYRTAVRTLAMGAASDPALGHPRFVSSARIGADLNRLSWSSTTPFLSVLLAPNLAPARLVVDPAEDYFWLSCGMAAANQAADRAVPVESRRLVRVHACLHR